MKPIEIFKLSKMIALHPEFSAIRITINHKRSTYRPFQAETIPQGNILVARCEKGKLYGSKLARHILCHVVAGNDSVFCSWLMFYMGFLSYFKIS